MGRFVKGDIVILPFPFSDLSASKKRPALKPFSKFTFQGQIKRQRIMRYLAQPVERLPRCRQRRSHY